MKLFQELDDRRILPGSDYDFSRKDDHGILIKFFKGFYQNSGGQS